jgi:hypothetical protein
MFSMLGASGGDSEDEEDSHGMPPLGNKKSGHERGGNGKKRGERGSQKQSGGSQKKGDDASAMDGFAEVTKSKKKGQDPMSRYMSIVFCYHVQGPCDRNCSRNNRTTCMMWHDESDRRRDPRARGADQPPWAYAPLGVSRIEHQYHPEVYKNAICTRYASTGRCPHEHFCAFRHVRGGVDIDAAYHPQWPQRAPAADGGASLQVSNLQLPHRAN